ncbi:MAG: 30S ribosomal protein S20 [Anaerolineales bacterium]|nr:30S ribosomal protein S20 [Anaerolineales bacterium]
MANIQSQIKRNRQNEKRRLHNRTARGAARTAVNQARTAFKQGLPETKEAVLKAIRLLDKAAEKGVIHKNNAARRKGRLMKKLATFVPTEQTVDDKKKASKKSAK